MRRFVVVGHRAVTNSDFNLNDLCGSTGRLDVLLRSINSAFFLSHDMRRDVELYLVLQGGPDPPKTIRMVGDELKYLNPDERSTGALIRNALMKRIEREEVKSTPGIYISRMSFKEVVEKCSSISDVVYLIEDGEDINEIETNHEYTFVLSDDKDLTEEEERILESYSQKRISLGPNSYHSDHCIAIVNNSLDRLN
jgi:tRNA (pseudouridine54-N1)-methyltransferase